MYNPRYPAPAPPSNTQNQNGSRLDTRYPVPAPPSNTQNQNGSRLDKEQALGILNHLNNKELQDLLDSNEKLGQLVIDNQQIKALSAEKTTIVASNKSLSEFNISREPRLLQGKERLSVTHRAAQDLHSTVTEKKARVDQNAGGTSLEEALALLKTSAESMDNETEAISESFLNKDMNIDTFLDTYIEKRILAHNRRIKAEKMAELVRQRSSGGHQQQMSPQHMGQWPTTNPAYGGGSPYAPPSVSPYAQTLPDQYVQQQYASQYRYGAAGGAMPSPQAYVPR